MCAGTSLVTAVSPASDVCLVDSNREMRVPVSLTSQNDSINVHVLWELNFSGLFSFIN